MDNLSKLNLERKCEKKLSSEERENCSQGQLKLGYDSLLLIIMLS